MILACQNISKSFGTDEILNNVSFHIEDYEKAAIVGINGAGKSTLLKIIMNEYSADSGEVIVAKGKTVGYLAQHMESDADHTIYEEILSSKQDVIDMESRLREYEAQMKHVEGEELERLLESYHRLQHEFERLDGYAYRSETVGILKGLGFLEEEFDKPMRALSGGQKTRVALAKLLVSKPDVILLDEPTNHLDIESITWLETFLLNYKGAVVIVAHDRYFLDRVVSKVIELDAHKCTVFLGNYTEYAKQKAVLRESRMREYLNQQQEIKHQEQVIEKLKSFNREKSIKRAESREKMLDKIERVEKPTELKSDMSLTLTPNIVSGNDVLSVTGLAKSYPPLQLFSGIDFEIKRGERVALIGANGTGKTTILKIITQMIEADAGEVRLGTNVNIGYYDQEHQVLHPEKTLFEEISDEYPYLNNTKIRNVLAAFLFTDDDVFKRISDLSGGERGRVSLAKLMLSEANFLILDEPTNHLDIVSKEILESALVSYTGTVLFVSHDRYFINKTATRILNLTNETVVNYIGNYDYYLEKKDELTRIYAPQTAQAEADKPIKTENKLDWKQQKEEQAKARKKANELKKTEDAIEEAEGEIAKLEEELSDPAIASNSAELNRITAELAKKKEMLDALYEQWEEQAQE
jgi:ATP-binding cassette subfamily F protein 3